MVISIAQAKQGMVLSDDIISDNNVKLLASGTPLTDAIINQLKNKGYDTLNITLTENEKKMWGITEDFVYPTINQKIIDSAKSLLTLLNTPEGYKKLNKESIKRIIHVAQIVTSKILASEDKLIYYLNDYAKNKDLISQSVRVATYATAMAKAYNDEMADANNMAKINLEEIATAGLLHNFGSICQDDDIRKRLNFYLPLSGNFPGLSIDKIKELKKNYNDEYIPYYSYNLLHDRKEISTFVKTVVVLSRETENEKGPLKAKQFTLAVYNKSVTMMAAKIISLARMFDDILITNIDHNNTLENTQAALGALFKVNYYNEDLMKLLTNNIPLYPVGTKVQLEGINNGVGVVVENYGDMNTWHRPSVKLLETGEIIDLRMENATVISRLVDDITETKTVVDNIDASVGVDQSKNDYEEKRRTALTPAIDIPTELVKEELEEALIPVVEEETLTPAQPEELETTETIENNVEQLEKTETLGESVPEVQPLVEETIEKLTPVAEETPKVENLLTSDVANKEVEQMVEEPTMVETQPVAEPLQETQPEVIEENKVSEVEAPKPVVSIEAAANIPLEPIVEDTVQAQTAEALEQATEFVQNVNSEVKPIPEEPVVQDKQEEKSSVQDLVTAIQELKNEINEKNIQVASLSVKNTINPDDIAFVTTEIPIIPSKEQKVEEPVAPLLEPTEEAPLQVSVEEPSKVVESKVEEQKVVEQPKEVKVVEPVEQVKKEETPVQEAPKEQPAPAVVQEPKVEQVVKPVAPAAHPVEEQKVEPTTVEQPKEVEKPVEIKMTSQPNVEKTEVIQPNIQVTKSAQPVNEEPKPVAQNVTINEDGIVQASLPKEEPEQPKISIFPQSSNTQQQNDDVISLFSGDAAVFGAVNYDPMPEEEMEEAVGFRR